jgi:outer membrane protein
MRASFASTLWGLLLFVVAASAVTDAEALEIGRISEVDLEELRRVIRPSRQVAHSPSLRHVSLSMEESVKIALEGNLQLQVFALDVEAQEPEIPAARAKFHPTAALRAEAREERSESKSGKVDRGNLQGVGVFLEQELPIGGSVTLGAGYAREYSDEAGFTPADPRDSTTTSGAGAMLEVRQPLLRGGRIYVARREILEAELDLRIRQSELEASILEVTAETKAAYYEVIQAKRLINVIEEAIARDEQLVEYSQTLFEAGRVSNRDVLSAEVRLSIDQARLANRRAELDTARNALRDVLGLPIGTRVRIKEETIPFHPIELRLDDWIERAIAKRPELMKIRTQLERNDLEIKIRRNALLPTLDVAGTYRQGFDWKSYDWRAGLGLEYPIGNVEARSRLDRAEIERTRTERQYQREKRRIERELRDIEVQLRSSMERLDALAVGVERARAKRETARARFERGLANNFDITDADEDLVNTESELLRALVDHAVNLAILEAKVVGPL